MQRDPTWIIIGGIAINLAIGMLVSFSWMMMRASPTAPHNLTWFDLVMGALALSAIVSPITAIVGLRHWNPQTVVAVLSAPTLSALTLFVLASAFEIVQQGVR